MRRLRKLIPSAWLTTFAEVQSGEDFPLADSRWLVLVTGSAQHTPVVVCLEPFGAETSATSCGPSPVCHRAAELFGHSTLADSFHLIINQKYSRESATLRIPQLGLEYVSP